MENPEYNELASDQPEAPDPTLQTPAKKAGSGLNQKRKKRRWPMWTFIGLMALVGVVVTSGFLGYYQGISIRKEAETGQVTSILDEQFRLGAQELAEGQTERARQRFEYILRLDPNFPGAQQGLAEALARINSTATPTPVPTPTPVLPTPTPDLRGVEEMFSQGQTSLANGDWTEAIDTLLKVRKADPTYKAVEIDGLLYLALRNRGADKILKMGDLEGGNYDLALAERFGPLDVEAQGYLNWSRMYITGASFWEINWQETINYFSQVAPLAPNLRDGSGWTATERYRLASIHYAEQLLAAEDGCAAVENFDIALSMGNLVDEKGRTYDEMYNEAAAACQGQSDEGEEGEEGEEEGEPAPPPDVPPAEGTPQGDGL